MVMPELLKMLFDTLLGGGFNGLGDKLKNKPKLCFNMVSTPDDELNEKELRPKTSPSEYGIEIFNLGEKPVVIESISLMHKKKIIADCFLDNKSRVIEPFYNVVYTMMEQETDALEWHCKQDYFEECDVIAYCVDGKKIKGKLKVPLIAIRAEFAALQE